MMTHDRQPQEIIRLGQRGTKTHYAQPLQGRTRFVLYCSGRAVRWDRITLLRSEPVPSCQVCRARFLARTVAPAAEG